VQFLPSLTYDERVETELKSKFKASPVEGCDINFTLTGNQKEEISLEMASAKSFRNFKPSLMLSTSTKNLKKFNFKPSAEFRNDWMGATFSLDYPMKSEEREDLKNPPVNKANFSTILGNKSCGFSAGIDMEFNMESETLHRSYVASYCTSDLEVTAFSKKKSERPRLIGVNYYQKLINRWKDAIVSAEVSYALGTNSTPDLTLGGSFKPDPTSSVKSRIDNKGIAGFSYTQKWGGPFSVTFLSEFNLLDLASNSAKFGVKFGLK